MRGLLLYLTCLNELGEELQQVLILMSRHKMVLAQQASFTLQEHNLMV